MTELTTGHMAEFVFPPAPQPYVPVMGGGKFPVRRIFCIGRNYSDHIREMGGDPDKKDPTIFYKPADAICHEAEAPYPIKTDNLHYEGELVVALKAGGHTIGVAAAASTIFGYAVGCDLTRRDLQDDAKATGGPWDTAKGLDNGAVIGMITPVAQCGVLEEARLELMVDGVVRQSANITQMIWPVNEIISILSQYFELCAGDLIYTGTPEGVGRIARGQRISVTIDGLCAHQVTLV